MSNFVEFQEIWVNLMSRAKHFYVADEWIRVLEHYELPNAQVAASCEVSVETVYNILNGKTLSGRLDTKKKLLKGLEKLGVSAEDRETLFSRS